jgi:hypothetical protein
MILLNKRQRIVLAAILLTGAAVYVYMRSKVKVEPEQPAFTTFTGYDQPELSRLVFPLTIDIDDIANKLNETLERKPIHVVIPIDKERGELELDLIFYDKLQLRWKNSKLYAEVPVQTIATATTSRLGIEITNKTPVEAKSIVSVLIKPRITAGWKIKSEAVIEDIHWEKEPIYMFGNIAVNLTKKVDTKLEAEREKLEKAIQTQINKVLNLTEAIEKIWHDIQKPIAINKKGPPLWLSITGTDLSACWNEAPSSNPSIMIAIEGYYRISGGDSLTVSTPSTKLPEYKELKDAEPGIDAHVIAQLPYEEMQRFAKSITDTLNLAYSGYKVRIKDIGLHGGDSLLFLKLKVAGDVRGSVYLQGKPHFLEDRKTFVVDSFNYDLYTQNEIASTAADWLQPLLLQKANDALVFRMDSLLHKLPDAMMNGIEKSKVGNKINLDMQELDVTPVEIRSAHDHLALKIHVTGHAALQLEREVLDGKKNKHKKNL